MLGLLVVNGDLLIKLVKSFCEPTIWFYGSNFSGGLARVYINNKYGFIDKTGKIIVEPQFDSVYSFIEGLASVRVDGKYGFIDNTGKIIIKPQFDTISYFSEGLASVFVDGKYGVIDKTGKIVIESQLGPIGRFSEGLASIYLSLANMELLIKLVKSLLNLNLIP